MQKQDKDWQLLGHAYRHDVKAPIRNIKGFLEILHEDYHTIIDEDGKKILRMLDQSMENLELRLADFMRFIQLDYYTLQKETINTSQLLNTIKTNYKSSDSTISISETIPNIIGDVKLIKQLFQELIENAIKFSPKNQSAVLNISGKTTGKEIEISIQDKGLGFDEQLSSKLFNPFTKLLPIKQYAGTGIGLALVKKITQKHQGSIVVKSIIGEGSNFIIKIPN